MKLKANAKRTLLWERWFGRKGEASPFGICLRPADSDSKEPPFPAWQYRPTYLPDPLLMYIGDAGIEEPMWVYLDFMRRSHRECQFPKRPIGVREITGLTLTTPVPLRSTASQRIVESGMLSTREGPRSLLEIGFDGNRHKQVVDFRPPPPARLSIVIGLESGKSMALAADRELMTDYL
jgi:hypothetical protein